MIFLPFDFYFSLHYLPFLMDSVDWWGNFLLLFLTGIIIAYFRVKMLRAGYVTKNRRSNFSTEKPSFRLFLHRLWIIWHYLRYTSLCILVFGALKNGIFVYLSINSLSSMQFCMKTELVLRKLLMFCGFGKGRENLEVKKISTSHFEKLLLYTSLPQNIERIFW